MYRVEADGAFSRSKWVREQRSKGKQRSHLCFGLSEGLSEAIRIFDALSLRFRAGGISGSQSESSKSGQFSVSSWTVEDDWFMYGIVIIKFLA